MLEETDMKSLIENIQDLLQFEGVKLCGWNNGGLQVNVEDSLDCGAVLAQVAEALIEYNPYGDNVQVTTNLKEGVVYILVLENEEYDE